MSVPPFGRNPESDLIGKLCGTLPVLPSVVHYYDDYENVERTLDDFEGCLELRIKIDGIKVNMPLYIFGLSLPIVKHIFVDWFSRKDPTTVCLNIKACISAIGKLSLLSFYRFLTLDVQRARSFWDLEIKPLTSAIEGNALRAVLQSLCNLSIGAWAPMYQDIVRALPGHVVDKYRTIRAGECFIPLNQQSLVVQYFDELVLLMQNSPSSIADVELRDACILVIVFQYAFRPGQVARIEVADVRVITTEVVHIAILLTKQRDPKKRIRVIRRIKREWSTLFIELLKRREVGDGRATHPERLLFQLTPLEVSRVVSELCREITGEDWTPTDLRHTAAQRMADAGVSRISLSEYMGHAAKHTVTVYFDGSPTQAQRVNQAMAISPIYSNLAQIARIRTVDKEMLLNLPEDKQVGGVPHGVAIAGIGGCDLGQSLCPKSPVLSCYDCRQFMPVRDLQIHEIVLHELRPVVAEFAELSTNAAPSPAFTQLRSTLDAVRRVVDSLKSMGEEK